ncbi:MAG: DUF3592 domain-containing protein [Clostridia bacterium]|nr:DUF3592 domain-containing protein [Clostridia bacterium]
MLSPVLFTVLFTGIWCLVGVIFLAIGIGMRRSYIQREERLRGRAEGRIVEVVRRERHSSRGDGVNWYPIVEFDVDGRRVALECDDGDGRKKYYEGQSVEVRYDPDDPATFRLEGDSAIHLLGKIFLAVGIGCIAIGLVSALVIAAVSSHYLTR